MPIPPKNDNGCVNDHGIIIIRTTTTTQSKHTPSTIVAQSTISRIAKFSLLPADAPKIDKHAVGRNPEHVNRLLLNGQHGKRSTIEINTLIMRQIDLITAEAASVGNVAFVNTDNVECRIFQWRPRIWTDGLVVAVNVVEERSGMLLFGNVGCRTNYHISTASTYINH